MSIAIPSEDNIRSRLASGKVRAVAYRIQDPRDHVSAVDMRVKLEDRAQHPSGLRCYLCLQPILHVGDLQLDHVTPLAAGGRHILWNIEPAHARCNLVKGDAVLPYDPPLDDYEPMLERLQRDPDALWTGSQNDRKLVRRSIRAPRPGAVVADLDRVSDNIARALLKQRDIYQPLSTPDLNEALGRPRHDGNLRDNHWVLAMGVRWENKNVRAKNAPDLRRRPAHPTIVPCRLASGEGQWGVPAFRLRTRFTEAQHHQQLVEQTSLAVRPDALGLEADQVRDWSDEAPIFADDRTRADRSIESADREELLAFGSLGPVLREFGFESPDELR